MSFSFTLYTDAALTQALGSTLDFFGDLSNPVPLVKQLWFGSTASGSKCQAASNPGTDQITLSVSDANPAGGEPATAIKLALTQSGLEGASPGAALNLGQTVLSGAANAVPFWVSFTDATNTLGTYTDLALQFNNLQESAQ